MNTEMKVGELICNFHMPHKLSQNIQNGEEIAQGLPPYAITEVFPVDEYPCCPDSWMNGSDITSSYFLAVQEDKGMWLNFNSCSRLLYDVAIVVSIQGINPITGLRTDKLRLEQYKQKCPIHDIDFKQDRYCSKCNFKWPSQNYLSTAGTPEGLLWLDGFRRPDGTVRQYVFTAEEMKGIAHQLIGKDKVYAIGVAFYLSKEKKPIPLVLNKERSQGGDFESDEQIMSPIWEVPPYKKLEYWSWKGGATGYPMGGGEGVFYNTTGEINHGNFCNVSTSLNPTEITLTNASCRQTIKSATKINDIKKYSDKKTYSSSPNRVKKLEIGAGALIMQKIYDDPKSIDYWNPEPSGMIYINYCDEFTLSNILKSGKIEQKENGFMEKLIITK